MKLIDILVEELPNRGGWPYGVRYITQDNGYDTYKGTICGYDSLPEFNRKIWLSNKPYRHANAVIMRINNIARDYTTAIITREQYEAALAAKNEGWIEWDGGECPVKKGTLVDVKYRDGDIYQNRPALGDRNIRWSHIGSRNDIIAYRLHKLKEADLNECIGQDSAPVWNGEGLPPVGVECESKQFAQIDWHKFRVVAIENGCVFGFWNDKVGVCLDSKHWEFRQLRTEAERKREDVRKAIYAAMNITDGDIADAIYDAISAGKIPGVKLED